MGRTYPFGESENLFVVGARDVLWAFPAAGGWEASCLRYTSLSARK